MYAEKSKNEYGDFLVWKPIKNQTDFTIVYLPDFLFDPSIHDNFCKDLEFFNYYGLYLPYDRKREYDEELTPEKINLNYIVRYVKDMVLSLNCNNIFIIAEGISAPIGLMVSTLLHHIVKKLVLVNPYNSKVSADTINILKNIPRDLNECYEFYKKILGENSPLLSRGIESEVVVRAMRKIYYNYEEIVEFADDLCLPKTLEAIKVYEVNIPTETLVIISENNRFIKPVEQLAAYQNKPKVKILQLPNDTYEPIAANEYAYFTNVMKFLVNNIGLNNENTLPTKEIYKYLSDEWKEYYRTEFADRLNEREKKEYLEKLNKWEKEIKNNEIQTSPYDEETTQAIAAQQIEAANYVVDYVNQNIQQIKEYEKTAKLNMIPDIVIDYNYQPNKIYQNAQGYSVYHDGKGNGFYKDYTGAWKKVINKPRNY